MRYSIVDAGLSCAFPAEDPFLSGASDAAGADILLVCGGALPAASGHGLVLVELGAECLGVHVAEDDARSNVLGFSRYRNGDDPPGRLVELVRQPGSDPALIALARGFFESAGFVVCVCADRPGRIVDRLVRPKYNAALRFLDEGLATREDIDATCRLGLGYPDGPLERVMRGGLERHYEVSRALHDSYGEAGYVPARLAAVAFGRRGR